jgi:glycosyltransferase involved in cell wall biosynthesis
MSRLRAESGSRTWFVEEPVSGKVDQPELRTADCDGVTRVWLVVPTVAGQPEFLGFDDPAATGYGDLVARLLADHGRPPAPDVWLYTPMAFDLAQSLQGGRLVYDVMDDLSAFHGASAGMSLRQRRAVTEADVVFTGGRSLHQAIRAQRRRAVHLFPSGVDQKHYASSRALRQTHMTPVAGYVGVVDERIDLELLAELAHQLPDWTVRVVGPVAKIDPEMLPRAENIEYVGFTPYEKLPAVMAEFDVALMPFALNEATRSISTTKTLEYLAAGLPVVSTRVPDVVADYGTVVQLAGNPEEFTAGCRRALAEDPVSRDRRVGPLLARQEWDGIAAAMEAQAGQFGGTGD